MNAKEFFTAVVKLRELQKKYFKSRSSLDLQVCKKHEKVVDDEIERVNKIKSEKQKSLF